MHPQHQTVQDRVIEELRFMAGPCAPSAVNAKSSLADDFLLTTAQVTALAATFEEIARAFNPEARIARNACITLTTVGDAVALVGRAAGFGEEWRGFGG